MKKSFVLASMALVINPAMASTCRMPAAHQDFAASSVVVAAEARAVSVTRHPTESEKYRQTVLWRVHEAWKGPHAYGKEFTTRDTINCPSCTAYKIKTGRLMVLYLGGREPYMLPWCSRTNFLEHSLKDVPLLYKLSGARHGT